MKDFFAMTAVAALTATSLLAVNGAEARGLRGGPGNISMNQVQVGPRVTSPVIRPERVGPQQFPQRQINGPRESGRGVNCQVVGAQYEYRHDPRTSRQVRVRVRGTGHTQCPQRI